jgi:hypothetical protein
MPLLSLPPLGRAAHIENRAIAGIYEEINNVRASHLRPIMDLTPHNTRLRFRRTMEVPMSGAPERKADRIPRITREMIDAGIAGYYAAAYGEDAMVKAIYRAMRSKEASSTKSCLPSSYKRNGSKRRKGKTPYR